MNNYLNIPLFRLAFRPFFLFAAIFAALAIALWLCVLNGWFIFQPLGGVYFWHGHELLFGFASAVLAGFLLTAVQTWTGVKGIQGSMLCMLFGLWVLARVLIALPFVPHNVIALIDISFFAFVAVVFARSVILSKNYRNLVFIPVLLCMATANGLDHYGLFFERLDISTQAKESFFWLILLVMTIVSGRIMPMFTANGTGTQRHDNIKWLEFSVIAITLILIALQGLGLRQFLPSEINALILLIAAILHAVRFCRWRFWITFRVPLLWSLHGAYFFIPVGLLVLVFVEMAVISNRTGVMHWLFIGAMANMMLSMTSRVALGHTGRQLITRPIASLAFAAIITAALARGAAIFFDPDYFLICINIAGCAWILAFLIYAIIYWPILTSPRPDGKDG